MEITFMVKEQNIHSILNSHYGETRSTLFKLRMKQWFHFYVTW